MRVRVRDANLVRALEAMRGIRCAVLHGQGRQRFVNNPRTPSSDAKEGRDIMSYNTYIPTCTTHCVFRAPSPCLSCSVYTSLAQFYSFPSLCPPIPPKWPLTFYRVLQAELMGLMVADTRVEDVLFVLDLNAVGYVDVFLGAVQPFLAGGIVAVPECPIGGTTARRLL